MLKLHNSLSRRTEEFKPNKGKAVTMYNCGPTVYDFAHIGNLRTFLFADILRRHLERSGYKVKQIMNITDVGHMLHDADVGEDKLEAAAKREATDPLTIARKYESRFLEDIKRLNVLPAAKYPRASEHVDAMIEMIGILMKKGLAYRVNDDLYYDVSKFPSYGKLSGNTLDALKAGARIEVNDEKRNPQDFALWIHNPNHVMQWDAPWSRGYPGWHIECSAMSTEYLGDTIDIHTGAEDNKFPHHECEIAQSEGATGKPFVRFWLHSSHLLVDGQKMSKSLNNFYKLDDLVIRGYEPRAVRFALIASHYREQQNFTLSSLDASVSALAKLDALFGRLSEKGDGGSVPVENIISGFEKEFAEAMDDDLNVPKALGSLFIFVREANAALDRGIDKKGRQSLLKAFKSACVDGLGLELRAAPSSEAPPEVAALLSEREKARKGKDFAKADELRAKIKQAGFDIKDGPEGPVLKKV